MNSGFRSGILPGVRPPKSATRLKLASNISTAPLWKFAASKKCAPLMEAQVRPSKTAPLADSFTLITAVVGSTPGFQPEIVPSLVQDEGCRRRRVAGDQIE